MYNSTKFNNAQQSVQTCFNGKDKPINIYEKKKTLIQFILYLFMLYQKKIIQKLIQFELTLKKYEYR